MISPAYLETTCLSFLVFLAGKHMVHPFVLHKQQTKPFSRGGKAEKAPLLFVSGLWA